MVTREYILRAALGAHTVIALAFLKALGVDGARMRARGRAEGKQAPTYKGMAECFRNASSPMDGRA